MQIVDLYWTYYVIILCKIIYNDAVSHVSIIYHSRCFLHGINLNPLKICQPVKFPVPKETPMISSLVGWDHSVSWDVPKAEQFSAQALESNSGSTHEIEMSNNSQYSYLTGHSIDGRVLFPATGFLVLTWKSFAKMKRKVYYELPVKFENVAIHATTLMPNEGKFFLREYRFKVTFLFYNK